MAAAAPSHSGKSLRQSDKSSPATSVPSRTHPSSFPLHFTSFPRWRLEQFFSFGWKRLSLSNSFTECCHRLILHTQIYCSDNSTVRQGHYTGFCNVRPQIVNCCPPTCEGHKSSSKLPGVRCIGSKHLHASSLLLSTVCSCVLFRCKLAQCYCTEVNNTTATLKTGFVAFKRQS